MTEAEAREIVERYESLLCAIAGRRAVLLCDLPIQFDTAGQVLVRQTDWAEWPCLRISCRVEDIFSVVPQ
jgi:hypothetical protein